MAFPPGFLEELRSRVPLASLVGRRVRLVRRGREHAGLCPFHHEKTPSFYVVEDKGFFHCFGCGAHGDAIGFLMRADNLDFIEAVERLAAEAGVAVPQQTPQDRERAQRQKTLYEALEAACKFYEARLWSTAGARAREYLFARGLDEATIRRFRLGWAPEDSHALRRSIAREIPPALLSEAGLLRLADDGEPYDYFRGRILFPIGDRAGRVIAFGGRVLGDGQPKYLNSPETPLFEKGRVLYGWSAARAAARDDQAVIVTEGYMDVIALHRAGFAGAVAPLGTALTEAQLQELWRLAPEPILCFDGDAAGERAATRALRRALPLLRPGQSLRFAALPAGEDPDSLLRGGGRPLFEQVLTAAQPLAEMLWRGETGLRPSDTPERRADLRRRLDEAVAEIAERSVREEYRGYLQARFAAEFRTRRGRRPPAVQRAGAAPLEMPPRPPRSPARLQREILFRILLSDPALLKDVAEEFAGLEIPEPELERLRRAILEADALQPALDGRTLRQHLVENGFSASVEGMLSPSIDTGFLARRSGPSSARDEWEHVVKMLKGGARSAFAEASDGLISDVSSDSWERFLAARSRALEEGFLGDDEA
jgi:DNA primase